MTITNNTFIDSGIGIFGGPFPPIENYNSHVILDNVVNGKPVYYYKDCTGINIDSIPVGQLIVANCTFVNIENLDISDTSVGIQVFYSQNVTISHNIISDNQNGIFTDLSGNLTITNNIASDESIGIFLLRTSNSTVSLNNASHNTAWFIGGGIFLERSSFNVISNNTVYNNDYGILIYDATSPFGRNRVYHNNLIDNVNQAYDDPTMNFWNDTYPSGGNYWSDYSPTCQDLYDGSATPQTTGFPDGICDLQYNVTTIPLVHADYYPLKDPVIITPADTTPPSITNLQPPDASMTNDNTPTIGADYSDASGIDIGSVVLSIDSTDVTSSATITADNVTYTPTSVLLDGNHTVYLEVRDSSPNSNLATATWNFTIDSTPPIANAGPDENIVIDDIVEFDGSGSSDNIDSLNQLNFTWNVTKDGILVITMYGMSPACMFDELGQFEVNLTVRDRMGNAGYDTMIVTVTTTKQDDFIGEYWWIISIIIIIVVIILVLFMLMRKRKPEVEGTPDQVEDSQTVQPPD